MNWIVRHFQRYRERQPWDFCWRITLEGLLVSILFGIMLAIFGMADREFDETFSELVFIAVVVAPVLETLLFQAFPIWLARVCGASFSTQIISSLVPFFLAHAIEGLGAGLCAGLIGGFYFAFTYAHWRNVGRWAAFWITAVSHFLHNTLAIAMLAAGL